MTLSKRVITTTIILSGFLFLAWQYLIPNKVKQSYMVDEQITSWQPEKDSFLGHMSRVKGEFSFGFGTPYDSVASGKQTKAPYSLFRFAERSRFGFELSPGEPVGHGLTLFPVSLITIKASEPKFYVNQKLVTSRVNEWQFREVERLKISADEERPVKGIITVNKGRYEYFGPEGLGVYTFNLPPWSVKNTGYYGKKYATILIASAAGNDQFSFIIYNWNPRTETLDDITIETQEFIFWQFTQPGMLLIQSLDEPLNITVVPQGNISEETRNIKREPIRVASKRDVSKDVKFKPKPKPKPKPKADARIVFTETFKSYEQGDPAVAWGSDVQVMGSQQKYLTSQIKGTHTAGQYLDFPKDFSLEFAILLLPRNRMDATGALPVYFIDASGDYLKVDLSSRYSPIIYWWEAKFPETELQKYRPGRQKSFRFRFTYKDGIAKVYLDGQFLASYYYGNKYSHFKEFQVTVLGGKVGYTNFMVKNLSDSPPKSTTEVSKPHSQSVAYTTRSIASTYEERFRDMKIEKPVPWSFWQLRCPCHPGYYYKDWPPFVKAHNIPQQDVNWFKKRFPQLEENKKTHPHLYQSQGTQERTRQHQEQLQQTWEARYGQKSAETEISKVVKTTRGWKTTLKPGQEPVVMYHGTEGGYQKIQIIYTGDFMYEEWSDAEGKKKKWRQIRGFKATNQARNSLKPGQPYVVKPWKKAKTEVTIELILTYLTRM